MWEFLISNLSHVSCWAMMFVHAPITFIIPMITTCHHYSQLGTVELNIPSQGFTSRSTIDINQLALPDTLCGGYPENFMSPLRCLENERSNGQKVITTTRSIFWKEEQDKSTKCRGSCVSALIMIVCAITASARLIWENVFSLQIDRRRDGENPFDPAKIRSASQTCAVDKNVSFPQTSAEQCQQQSIWAVVHRQVQVMIATEHNTIYNA